jgi:hypothetical protein
MGAENKAANKVTEVRGKIKKKAGQATDELPAADEEAIFKHYSLTYQPGASGERRLTRRRAAN